MSLLQLESLACERGGNPLFSGLSCCIEKGGVLQLRGPNGCGKTTLLKVLAGLSTDFQGAVSWRDGSLRSRDPELLSDMLYIGHKTGIKLQLTPRENLSWLTMAGNDAIGSVLKAFLLSGYEDQPCYTLSAGQRQRVALSRLCLSSASVWLLDEPFTSIDVHGAEILKDIIVEHAKAGGLVVLITHQDFDVEHLQVLDLEDYRPSSKRGGV